MSRTPSHPRCQLSIFEIAIRIQLLEQLKCKLPVDHVPHTINLTYVRITISLSGLKRILQVTDFTVLLIGSIHIFRFRNTSWSPLEGRW
jgi:hypothetical protein